MVTLLMPACLQVAALENQLASSIAAASGGGSRAAVGSPFVVPAFGEAGGLLRRSLDSGIKTKTTLRLEEEGGLKAGIMQRQFPPSLLQPPTVPICSLFSFPLLRHHPLCPTLSVVSIDEHSRALAEANKRMMKLEQVALRCCFH